MSTRARWSLRVSGPQEVVGLCPGRARPEPLSSVTQPCPVSGPAVSPALSLVPGTQGEKPAPGRCRWDSQDRGEGTRASPGLRIGGVHSLRPGDSPLCWESTAGPPPIGNILQNPVTKSAPGLGHPCIQPSGEWRGGVLGPGEGRPCLPHFSPGVQFTPVVPSGPGGGVSGTPP